MLKIRHTGGQTPPGRNAENHIIDLPTFICFWGTLDYKALLAAQRLRQVITASTTTSTRWLVFSFSFTYFVFSRFQLSFFSYCRDFLYIYLFFQLHFLFSTLFRICFDFPPHTFWLLFCFLLVFPSEFFRLLLAGSFFCTYECIRGSYRLVFEPASSARITKAHPPTS